MWGPKHMTRWRRQNRLSDEKPLTLPDFFQTYRKTWINDETHRILHFFTNAIQAAEEVITCDSLLLSYLDLSFEMLSSYWILRKKIRYAWGRLLEHSPNTPRSMWSPLSLLPRYLWFCCFDDNTRTFNEMKRSKSEICCSEDSWFHPA